MIEEIPISNATHWNSNRPFRIEITGLIRDGVLSMFIRYNEKEYNRNTIQYIQNKYKSNLEKIILHCLEKENSELTASDLSSLNIKQDELDTVYDIIENL